MQIIIVLICMYALFKLQTFIYKVLWKKGFEVKLSLKSETCEEGDINVLKEVVTNDKFLPLPMVHVKFNTPRSFMFENEDNSSVTDYYYRDDVFTVYGHQIISRELKFKCTKRGFFHLNDISVTTSDLLMREALFAKIPNNVIIHVFPKKLNIKPFEVPFNNIMGNYITKNHIIDDPFEFRGIREYQPYDTMRSINWKVSAKLSKLHVNTFFTTASQEVVIFLNNDSEVYSKNEKLQEYGIRIASTLANNFLGRRVPVALETNGHDAFTKESICCKSGSGDGHMFTIDHALSRIDLSLPYDNYIEMVKSYFEKHASSNSLNHNAFYIFISNYRHDDIMNYYKELKASGLSCYFIIPEYKIVPVDINIADVIKWEVE